MQNLSWQNLEVKVHLVHLGRFVHFEFFFDFDWVHSIQGCSWTKRHGVTGVTYLYDAFDRMLLACHVRVSEWIYSCLNAKELLARNMRHIWSLGDCNGIRNHNHLVRKRTLVHLAKLAKWSSCAVSTYLYGAFDCMLLSCHVRVSEWIYTLSNVT